MTNHALTLDRQMDATPDAVWRCLTEPALIEQWFAPKPVRVFDVAMDPVAGGDFSNSMEIPGAGTVTSAGCVLVAIPNERLVWTSVLTAGFVPSEMKKENGAFPFTADITLTAKDGGCLYQVRALHPNAAYRQTHEEMGFEQGWGIAADQLAALAATI